MISSFRLYTDKSYNPLKDAKYYKCLSQSTRAEATTTTKKEYKLISLKMSGPVARWLDTFVCKQYYDVFTMYGFDTLNQVSRIHETKMNDVWTSLNVFSGLKALY